MEKVLPITTLPIAPVPIFCLPWCALFCLPTLGSFWFAYPIHIYLFQVRTLSPHLVFVLSQECVHAENLFKVLFHVELEGLRKSVSPPPLPLILILYFLRSLPSPSLHNWNWNQSYKAHHASGWNETGLNLCSKCLFTLYSKCSVWGTKVFTSNKLLEK
jgi:cell division protein FtsW (lipid II flippase)